MPSPAAARLPLVVLAVLVLLGAAMRVWQARESLWLDELHTAWCAMRPLPEVVPRATIGNQSPLFFWLEWLLVQVLGASELALRLPSLVAGSLLPAALYWLTGRWTRQPWLGVLAAWLVVVDPVQIFYATEARPYALVQCLAVVHVGMLAELLVRPRPVLHVAFILLGGLLFHLHYTAALLFPAEIAAIALITLLSRQSNAANPRLIIGDFLAIALVCLPATGNLLAIFARRTNWELFVPQPTLTSVITLLPWSWTAAIVLVGQASRLSRLAVGQASRLSDAALDPDDDVPSILFLCWLIIPLLLAWLLTATDTARLFFLRYLIVSAPAALILAVLSVRLIPWRGAQIAAAIAVALLALWSPILPQFAKDRRLIADRHADWRSAIAHFNQQPDRDRYPLLLATQLIESDALRSQPNAALTTYCLSPVHSLYPIDADPSLTFPLPRTNPGQLTPHVRDVVRSRGGAWLIVAGRADAADDAARHITAAVAEGGQRSEVRGQQERWQVVQRQSFGTLHVMLIRPPNLEP
ncbi:MAG: glycosyltransferase family 39 protein [Planctomycetaceae bacterium]|nr:glycosyltransferase family 39 protein [Planctomycetaceae bacterium]